MIEKVLDVINGMDREELRELFRRSNVLGFAFFNTGKFKVWDIDKHGSVVSEPIDSKNLETLPEGTIVTIENELIVGPDDEELVEICVRRDNVGMVDNTIYGLLGSEGILTWDAAVEWIKDRLRVRGK